MQKYLVMATITLSYDGRSSVAKKMLNALLATGEFLPQKNVKVYSASDITKDDAKQIMKASAGNIMKKYEKLL